MQTTSALAGALAGTEPYAAAIRDAYVLTLTGYDTFVENANLVRRIVGKAHDIRVLLANPVGCLQRQAGTPPQVKSLSVLRAEIDASLAYLCALRREGRKVAVRFYDEEIVWKVIVLGGRVWAQYCRGGFRLARQPEYSFALQRDDSSPETFVPFYAHFLDRWNNSRHAQYDFDTRELVYRDEAGDEVRRSPLQTSLSAAPRPIPRSAP